MTHTPGPWKLSGERVVGPSGNTIADCRYRNGANDGPLIAAAPELLKACQYLSEWVEHTVPTWTAEVECGLQLAKEAIAKATGGAQ